MHTRARLLLACGAGIALWATTAARAQEANPTLPLKDVVLFSSGVGYFQRSGKVEGTATIPLSFRAEQVNDILKSLVLFDTTGSVRPVTYTTNETLTRHLGAAGQALNPNVTLGNLLRQFQGARVRLETGGEPITGRIVSVSTKPAAVPLRPDGNPTVVQVDVLNVFTDTGLRALPLDGITAVKLLDERLDRELRESLELLGSGLDDQKRKVELKFAGAGVREVKAGYLQEMPVWKTSYRLVLDAGKAPYLQGWAIVENTTEEDWKEVRLSLVSGRPISFIQDLYQPLYVPRPVVQAQVIGSPTPQLYQEALNLQSEAVAKADPNGRGFAGGRAGGLGGMPGPQGPPAAAAAEPQARRLRDAEKMRKDMGMSMDGFAQSVVSQAQGTERGALFEYAIKDAISLPRGQAALVPIVTTEVGGEALSIYDPNADGQHALNAFRLKNTTGLHLAGGPITVFRDGIYAGDAQIGNLQPGEERLLSYAVDLDLVTGHEAPKFRQETVTVTAKNGILQLTRKQQRENVYTFRNQGKAAKRVVVQQGVEPEFKLVQPEKATEKTAEQYRFAVSVPAGGTAELKVVTERPVQETIALIDMDLNVIVAYAQNAQVSEKLRGALKQLIVLRRKVVDIQNQRAVREGELKAIDMEQARIRQNMAQLDRNSPLYQQYVKKLTEQESRIEKLREEIAKLQDEEKAAQKEVREFIDTLTIE